jgi:hypothetical protein
MFKMKTEEQKLSGDLVSKMTSDKGISFLDEVSGLFKLQRNYCDLFLSSQEMMDELKGADILIGDAIYPCSSLVADKFDVPHVLINMHSLSSPFERRFGISSNPSYIPQLKSGLSSKMGFLYRMKNLGFFLVNIFISEAFLYPTYSELKIKHKIKPHKSIRDSMATVDMILLEKDFIMDNAQPILPSKCLRVNHVINHVIMISLLTDLERISNSYEWETYGTDLQHVHGTACSNIEMASHCFRASHPITT